MTLDACADLVRRGDPDRWISLRGQPASVRARLLPVYAANIEIARAPWVSTEPMIGQMRLAWWREVMEEIATGAPVRRHEVATPLAQVLPPAGAGALDAAIVARHRDLELAPFADAVALIEYLEDTGGGLMRAAGAALGAAPRGLAEAGFAMGLAAYLRAVPELRARGRRPLPSEDPRDIAELARIGLDRLGAARGGAPDRAARPALLSAWRAGTVLRMARAEPDRVLAGRLEISPFRRDMSLLAHRLRGW
ncbi:squalene/phytoene synthase family protein [Poseidonocella sp. HB161398]|uniref:squalene/phytoene synthase family protein n=1 Tax=Poseidonocella sp. HB161398 TaxID=2320855 RepID=UPI0011081054|nr:squalene/phytoene synthase family protein [Poseidonocella sp. HB161398]